MPSDIELITRLRALGADETDQEAADALYASARRQMGSLRALSPGAGVEAPIPVAAQVAAEINRRRARSRARTSRADGAR